MKFDRPIIRSGQVREIAGFYGLVEPLEIGHLGGIPNVTYRVASAGRALAIRVCNNGYTSPEHLRGELAVLCYLRDNGFDLAPAPVPGTDGELVQHWRGYRVVATTFIEGVAGDQAPLGPAQCAQIGSAVARLGTALATLDHGLPSSESFRARSVRLLDGLAGHARRLAWPGDLGGVPAQFDRAMRALETAGPDGWYPAIHADIWPPNTIYRDGTLVGLIDFDDLSCGPPVLDIAAVVCEFAFPEATRLDEPLARAALAGFRAAGGVLGPVETDTGRTLTGAGGTLADAIEALCASWLGANALHGVSYEESRSLVERLALLADPDRRAEFAGRLDGLWRRAGDGGPPGEPPAARIADRPPNPSRSPV